MDSSSLNNHSPVQVVRLREIAGTDIFSRALLAQRYVGNIGQNAAVSPIASRHLAMQLQTARFHRWRHILILT